MVYLFSLERAWRQNTEMLYGVFKDKCWIVLKAELYGLTPLEIYLNVAVINAGLPNFCYLKLFVQYRK